MINLTKTLALELAPHDIRVNAIAPDITLTEGLLAVAPPGASERMGLTVPNGTTRPRRRVRGSRRVPRL